MDNNQEKEQLIKEKRSKYYQEHKKERIEYNEKYKKDHPEQVKKTQQNVSLKRKVGSWLYKNNIELFEQIVQKI